MVNNSPHESEPNTYNEVHRFFEFSLDLFGISGFDGFLKRFNPAWEQTLGYTTEELLSKPIIEFIHPDDRTATINQRQQTQHGDSIVNFTNRYICKDGSVKWLEWTAHPYPEQGANYIVGRDVTEQKQDQDALRESEQAMRGLLNGIPNQALLMKLDGTIMALNEGQAALYGLTIEDMLGKNIYAFAPDDENTRKRRAWAESAIQGGKPISLTIERGGQFLQTTASPLVDSQGTVYAMVISNHNITHLKQTEALLRQSEEQFRTVFEWATEGLLVTNEAGEILLLNGQIEQMFGYTRDELIGQSVDVLLPESQRHQHVHHRQKYNAHPVVRPMGAGRELSGRHKDGTIFPTEISLSLIQNHEGTQVIAFVIDITERKQMEQQRLQQQRQQLELQQEREILELRQRFMSMVSHEFRTPLTVIASSCELLENYYDRLPKERQIEKLQIINGQVRAMVGLLDDILQLGKIQAGAVDFVPEILDLAALCNRVLSTIQIVDQHHHQLQLQLSDFVPPVKADRRMLEHAVGNLLSNAVKYSPPGSRVEFSLSGQGEQVRMEIRDQGIGIPLVDQPHLFEPFYRAQNARQIEGTGLGLAIVKHNIEKHGGSISCHSIEGTGTTFTIDLPVAVAM